jgi:endo-1,4-beta-xylanase
MVAVSALAVGLSALAGVLAAPTEVAAGPIQARGPTNFVLDDNHPLMIARRNFTMSKRSNTNYNQDYTTGGTVNYSPGTNEFTLSFNTQQDFVVGVGWNPGNTIPITHSGSFTVSSGLGSLSVYGWSTNPLVEYYVIDCEYNMNQGGTQKGTLTSDGATYTIWENQRVNEPSIQGTSTFNQYISIRQGCTTSGTVTIQNHFNAWASHGMNLGSLNFQVIAVESWSGAGSASQSVTNTGGGSSSPSSTHTTTHTTTHTASATSSSGGGGGGSCSALYGQCGGIGWSGPTCCSQGSCKVGNAYYSQCLS